MECQNRAVANELHQIQKRFGRVFARFEFAWRNPVDQHAFADLLRPAQQRRLVLVPQLDAASLDNHRTNGKDDIAAHVETAGFKIKHHHALHVERAKVQRGRRHKLITPLQLFEFEDRAATFEPGHIHNW